MLSALLLMSTVSVAPIAPNPASAARMFSGHQPIVKFPDLAIGMFRVWPSQRVTFEVHSTLPQSWGITSLNLKCVPAIKGAPTTVALDGDHGTISFKTPSDTAYYDFTLWTTYKGVTYRSLFTVDVSNTTGTTD